MKKLLYPVNNFLLRGIIPQRYDANEPPLIIFDRGCRPDSQPDYRSRLNRSPGVPGQSRLYVGQIGQAVSLPQLMGTPNDLALVISDGDKVYVRLLPDLFQQLVQPLLLILYSLLQTRIFTENHRKADC